MGERCGLSLQGTSQSSCRPALPGSQLARDRWGEEEELGQGACGTAPGLPRSGYGTASCGGAMPLHVSPNLHSWAWGIRAHGPPEACSWAADPQLRTLAIKSWDAQQGSTAILTGNPLGVRRERGGKVSEHSSWGRAKSRHLLTSKA